MLGGEGVRVGVAIVGREDQDARGCAYAGTFSDVRVNGAKEKTATVEIKVEGEDLRGVCGCFRGSEEAKLELLGSGWVGPSQGSNIEAVWSEV